MFVQLRLTFMVNGLTLTFLKLTTAWNSFNVFKNFSTVFVTLNSLHGTPEEVFNLCTILHFKSAFLQITYRAIWNGFVNMEVSY